MIEKIIRRMVEANGLPAKVTATTDRREALTGARYVMNCVRIGGLEAFAEDTISPMADAEAMARAASAGGRAPEIAEIAGRGHLTAVQNPDAVTAVLRDWLAATGGAA